MTSDPRRKLHLKFEVRFVWVPKTRRHVQTLPCKNVHIFNRRGLKDKHSAVNFIIIFFTFVLVDVVSEGGGWSNKTSG